MEIEEKTTDKEWLLTEPIEQLGVNYSIIRSLMNAGIETIGDLVKIPKDTICRLVNTKAEINFPAVRKAVMDMGLFLDEDRIIYESHGIPEEIARQSLARMNLPAYLVVPLRKANIIYLGDLLTYDYRKLFRLRRIGPNKVKELTNFVHKLGYSFSNEDKNVNIIKEKHVQSGIPLIGSVLPLDNYILNILYKAGIYTLDDLLLKGPSVFELKGIGPKAREEITRAMQERKLDFLTIDEEPWENKVDVEPQLDVAIKDKIERKRQISIEYHALIITRERLIAMEKELDQEIARKLQEYQAISLGDDNGR